jgi:hypothetical protein
MKVLSYLTALLLTLPNLQAAQQTSAPAPSSSSQATTLLTQSAAALTGRGTLSDVTLSGTARRIAGSDDETGTGVVKALARAGSRIDLSLPSGTRSELRNISGAEPAGSWSGTNGVSHPISNHNLFTDPGWFPAFTLVSMLSAPNAVITYVGQESRDGQSVIHITAARQFPGRTASGASIMQHLSETQVLLGASTLLPVAIVFNTHPDNNALLDIPMEIRFSDYRSVNGAQIPFHVQEFINNSLALDLQFESVVLNSGITASSFSL